MSLFADYSHERSNKKVLETDRGFATYEFYNDSVYIEDIFVSKEYRNTNEASKMADQIAEIALSKGIRKLHGTVCPTANNSTTSLRVLLAYGFVLESCTNNLIIMKKELA